MQGRNWMGSALLAALALVACATPLRAQEQDDDAPRTQTPRTDEAFRSDPKFQKAYQEAAHGRLTDEDRLSAWKSAGKAASGKCAECLRGVITMQMRLGRYKDAAASALALKAIAVQPEDRVFALMQHGQALFHANGDQPKPAQLTEAEADFNAVLTTNPRHRTALFFEGRSLAMMKREPEAKAIFVRYLDRAKASDKYRLRVERFVEDPHLAALPMAPAFTVTTNDGEQFTLDEMKGRVVLLDFWATWCGPCNEELPEMRRIAKNFAGQPLVILSVSWDDDAEKWKAFIAKEHMTWPQFRDRNQRLTEAFGVDSIPHYFTIDADGVLQKQLVGSGNDVEGVLKKLVARAKDAERKKAAATDKPATGQ